MILFLLFTSWITLSHLAPLHAHCGEANRGAIGIEVQSNRGYPVEDLVIGIIILDRCNFDTTKRCKRLAAHLGLFAYAAIFCLGVPSVVWR